jgi:hypothetical protein
MTLFYSTLLIAYDAEFKGNAIEGGGKMKDENWRRK